MLQDMVILHQACAATTTRPVATVSARTQSDHMYALSSVLAANITPPATTAPGVMDCLQPLRSTTLSKQPRIVLALIQRDPEQSTGPPCITAFTRARLQGQRWGFPHSRRPLRAVGDGRTLGSHAITISVFSVGFNMVSPRRIVYGRAGRGRRRDEEGCMVQDGKSGSAAHGRRTGQQREREDGCGTGSAR
ncbi:hypothetical protein K438DRAFT_2019335 [Mycena galopus ATCC 62051]|nr:hypothetical protein K438DRAFT_2019335 [Mycena galopus ATCC 62051]